MQTKGKPKTKVAVLKVGTVIRRLVALEYFLAASRVDPPHVVAERDRLEEALNKLSFKMGFTCDVLDGYDMLDEAEAHPNDTVLEILKRDARTSCCRVTFTDVESCASTAKSRGARSRTRG